MLSDSRRTCLRVISEAIRTQITWFLCGWSFSSFLSFNGLLLCSVPRGIPRFSFFFSPASDAGFSLFCAPPCISAPVSILPDAIRPFRMSFPRHRMPVFFPLYGEVGSSLLRFNPATISRPLRTSTSRPFRMSIPRHWMPAFILSIVLDVIRLSPSSIPPFDGSR